MADPLSIAASVAGLLGTAAKICSVLSHFVAAVADAPQSARAALTAVEEVRLALDMVKTLVDTVATLPSRRKELVRLDHIAITFSNCVLTLSELESLVVFKDGIMHRLRWVWGESKVLRLLPRLESQKASLSLMVTVLMCQSEMEALSSRERLNAAVDQILERDEAFRARIQNLDDMQLADDRSIRFYDNESTVTARRMSAATIQGPVPSSSDPPTQIASSTQAGVAVEPSALVGGTREFEAELEQSRPYTRNVSNDSDISFTSSAVRSHAWSMLSLNDVSIIAVFRLPITLDDIEAFGPGLTMATLLKGQAISISQQASATEPEDGPELKVSSTLPIPARNPNRLSRTAKLTAAETSQPPNRKLEVHVETAVSVTVEPGHASGEEQGTPDNAAENEKQQVTSFTPMTSYLEVPTNLGTMRVDGKKAPLIKLVVVGDTLTEKTTALISYTTNKFPTDYVPTVFDNYAVTVMIGDDPYVLALFDTAGHEDYDRLRHLDYANADVFLVFARIGVASTYENVKETWVPEISHHCPNVPFIMVGISSHDDDELFQRAGKEGLPDTHEAYTRMGMRMASELGAVRYLECNIFTQHRLKNVFDEAIVAALQPPRRKGKERKPAWRPPFFRL